MLGTALHRKCMHGVTVQRVLPPVTGRRWTAARPARRLPPSQATCWSEAAPAPAQGPDPLRSPSAVLICCGSRRPGPRWGSRAGPRLGRAPRQGTRGRGWCRAEVHPRVRGRELWRNSCHRFQRAGWTSCGSVVRFGHATGKCGCGLAKGRTRGRDHSLGLPCTTGSGCGRTGRL